MVAFSFCVEDKPNDAKTDRNTDYHWFENCHIMYFLDTLTKNHKCKISSPRIELS